MTNFSDWQQKQCFKSETDEVFTFGFVKQFSRKKIVLLLLSKSHTIVWNEAMKLRQNP